ncbi:FlgO family outer membrane protein [Desulfococcaceae bacterium HSG9]|nr:FlgO family outer membrane protein [Desulfococcaceae bacterium HSG9]
MTTKHKISKGLLSGALVTLLLLACVYSVQASTDINKQIEMLTKKLIHIKEGEVLKNTDTGVYISLGSKHGVASGNRFKIIRQGAPIKAGDEIVGHEQIKIAEIEVNIEQEKISGCKILNKSELPKAGDKVYQLGEHIKTLIVGQIVCNQKPRFNLFTRSVQEQLITAIAAGGNQVVKRIQLDKVLEQLKLGDSGLLKVESAKKIGKLLKADGIVLGNVNDMGDTISINARIVDIETGKAVNSAEVELPETPDISKQLKTPSPQRIGDSPPPDPSEEGCAGRIKNAEGFKFELISCKKQDGNVKFEFFITSDADTKFILLGKHESKLFDNFNNIYEASGVSVASCSKRSQCDVDLVGGVRAKASLSFEEVDLKAISADVLEIKYRSKKDFKVQFRKIPLK